MQAYGLKIFLFLKFPTDFVRLPRMRGRDVLRFFFLK
jgi:hypothetical protein